MRKSKSRQTKIVLTGGHAATSALAVIEKLQETHPDWEIVWIGSSKAFAKETATTLDFLLFPKMGVKCYSIKSGKLQRKISISTFTDLIKVPTGLFQAIKILSLEKPDLVLSFGGYAALPVAVAAKVFNIPVLIHEQTPAIGLANKISLPFTTEVLLARKNSIKYFGGKKKRITGLPLHQALLAINTKTKKRPEVIYVTGGSRGSRVVNNVVKELLPELLRQFTVIHQSGALDEQDLVAYKRKLDKKLQKKYEVKGHIDPRDVASIYQKADIIIGRAGAHSVAEIIALNKAAILIPIPWVQKNEQLLNARLAKKYVGAVIVDEKDLTAQRLRLEIEKMSSNWTDRKITTNNKIAVRDRNAASEIIKVIEEYVQ